LKLRRLLQGDLDNIVAKALKKNSQERYSSVKEFADDLRRYLNNEPVLARGDNTWYRARKFVVRNRLRVALSSAALAAVLATAGIALFEANAAEVERDRALALSSRNEAVAAFLNTLITEAAAAGKPVAVSDMLERSEALARSTYQTSPEHRAAVLGMLGSYYQANGKDARAESLMREALQAIRTSSDRDLRRQLTCDHAGTLTFLGKAPDAIRVLNDVVADPHTTARQAAVCLDYLTQAALEQNDAAGALKFATLALERLHRSVDPLPLQEALLLNSMAFAEGLSGRNDLAGQSFERSLALYARAGREHSADAIAIRNNWAVISEKAGNPRRALDLFEQSLRMVAENDPRGEPPPYLIGNRGRALEMLGRYRDSREAYAQCIAAAVQAGAIRVQANCLLGAASSSRGLGDLSAAEDALGKMSAIVSASLPATSTEAIALPNIRGRIELARGQLAKARADLDLAIAAGKVVSLKTNALLARAELNLDENKMPAAQADARQALALAQASQGGIPYSNHTGLAWLMLGRVLAKQGETAPAHNAFQAAIEHLSNTVDNAHPMLVRARELGQR
jgi:tetratricopeptide (TPR) repeat protein